MKRC
jgi:hypothetical protein